MIIFSIGIVLAIIGVALVFVGDHRKPDKFGDIEGVNFRPIGAGIAAVAVITVALTCFTIVSTKNIGVVSTFGRPTGTTLSNGLHLKAPWNKVTELDGTVQTDEYRGEDCIYVRIGDGSRACVTLANRWRIVPERGDTIFTDFRSDDPTDSFRKAIVSTQLKAAVQKVMGEYNPIAKLQAVGGSETAADVNFSPDYDAISTSIEAEVRARLGGEPLAEVISITVSYVSLSDSTQAKIDDFIAAIGETRVAQQQKETAQARAEANRILSSSVSNDPNVLVSRCLDLLADMVQQGEPVPAGFSCWPGSNNAVVIPSAAR